MTRPPPSPLAASFDLLSPSWLDPASSMQMHLIFEVDDLDATEAMVLADGATKLAAEPGQHVRVLADPGGHPFCLSARDYPDQA